MTEQADVVIVGARAAGSPLAALLARRGARVAVLEQAVFPQPTLSSNLIESDGLAFLARLGVLDRVRRTKAPFLSHIDLRFNDFRVVAPFPEDFPGFAGGAVSIRRQVLDPILADAAAEAGAHVRMGAKATGLLEEDGRVVGVRYTHGGTESAIRARLVVGADGRASTIAKLVGARRYNVIPNQRWYYWTYFEGADLSATPTFIFHRWEDRHIFGAPTDDGLYIVGVSPQQHEREQFRENRAELLMEHVGACAPVAEIVSGARIADKIYGIARFESYFREASGPGWVLMGDAGHFKDPAAGRGIGDAFNQADWLAPAVADALGQSDARLDQVTAQFGVWRDQHYAPYFWLASDLGTVGPLPFVMPEVLEQLHVRGQIAQFLDVLSHQAAPQGVVTPARLMRVVGRRMLRRGTRRLELARRLRLVIKEQKRRRYVFEYPEYETAGG